MKTVNKHLNELQIAMDKFNAACKDMRLALINTQTQLLLGRIALLNVPVHTPRIASSEDIIDEHEVKV